MPAAQALVRTLLVGTLLGVGGCDARRSCCPPPVACDRTVVTVPRSAAPASAGAPAPAGVAPIAAPSDGADQVAAKVVHNYKRLSPSLARGASPVNDEDFAALAAAGVKSIVSVDGAAPPVELAARHGIRYVHVPMGYDGISESKGLELAKTFERLAPAGPIFVHCHHGKHRGPAACQIARILLDGISNEDAIHDMQAAGTDPKYKGLYESVAAFQKPTAQRLADVKVELPSVAAPDSRSAAMAAIDHTWENLKTVRQAKWLPTKAHADLDPPHEATMLAERFREYARRADTAHETDEFRAFLTSAEEHAWALSRAITTDTFDLVKAEAEFDAAQQVCSACHTKFRDNVHR